MNRNGSLRRKKLQEEIHDRRERKELLDTIQHHGVKGMKWGVRRYQPYTKSNKRKGGEGGIFKGIREKRAKKKTEDKRLSNPKTKPNKIDNMSEAEEKKMEEVRKKHTNYQSFTKDWNENYADKFKKESKRKTMSVKDSRKKGIVTTGLDSEGNKQVTDSKSGDTYTVEGSSTKQSKRISKEIKTYEKKSGDKDFSKKFFEKYDDIEMWDLYSPEELMGALDVKKHSSVNKLVNEQFLKHGLDLSEEYGE